MKTMVRSEDLMVERFESYAVNKERLELSFEQFTTYVYISSFLIILSKKKYQVRTIGIRIKLLLRETT